MSNLLNPAFAVIARLAQQNPKGWVGRTALMKYCYFLQVLRDVPLGYRFSLYSYGPFDSAVLSDLGNCEALGIVKESAMLYNVGYGYQVRNVISDEEISRLGGAFLKDHQEAIDWVLGEFGSLAAGELELSSTIVYIDQEASDTREHLAPAELTRRVRDVKPHFTETQVTNVAKSLIDRGLLRSL